MQYWSLPLLFLILSNGDVTASRRAALRKRETVRELGLANCFTGRSMMKSEMSTLWAGSTPFGKSLSHGYWKLARLHEHSVHRSAKFHFPGCVYFCLALPGWCLAKQKNFLADLSILTYQTFNHLCFNLPEIIKLILNSFIRFSSHRHQDAEGVVRFV